MPALTKIARTLFWIFILAPVSCLAQYSISGRVLNFSDNKPVANADVFIANATIGAATAENGTFVLKNVKAGKYNIIVSIIGFEAYSQDVIVTNSNITLPDIALAPKTRALKEVTIKVDKNRDRYLEWFTDEFLGTSELAKACKITNPEALSFDYDEDKGILTATSDGFLIIENNALGYKLNYLLSNFTLNNKDKMAEEVHYDGSVLFQEMKGKTEQAENWQKRREEAYQNSSMHFFRSLINNRNEAEGFRVTQISRRVNTERPADNVINAEIDYYKNAKPDVRNRRDSLAYWVKKSKLSAVFEKIMTFPLKRGDVLEPSDQPGIYRFGCENDALYVNYNRANHFHIYNHFDPQDKTNTETTIINFASPEVLIDGNGIVLNTNNIIYSGIWAMKRVADLLPVNYEPFQNGDERPDSTVAKNISARLNTFLATHVNEKAYLHFDKPYYAVGDTLYFKAYVANSDSRRLSVLSSVLHVELINTGNHIDKSINLLLNNGIAWGDFALPDSLPGGTYRVRAYTQLMRNYEATGFFEKDIRVIAVRNNNPSVIAKSTTAVANNKYDIQFFPEGGSLVTDVRCKVAFKAIGSTGTGVNVKGSVIDNEGKEVCPLVSQHLGMGYFYLEPRENKTYKAKIIYDDGTQAVVDLPHQEEKGVALSVSNEMAGQLQVAININKSYYRDNQNKDYTLVVYSGGESNLFICKLNRTSVITNIEKNQLHSGVVRITLFSPNGEPLSERLVFNKNTEILHLNINSDKQTYATREKVKINLSALKDRYPASGHFSVAVTDDTRVPVSEEAEHTILTDLLLTPDLKGYVEKPNYYFLSDVKEVSDNLDILMLTQGYSRFEWKEVISNNPDQVLAFQAERSLELEGMIKTMAGKPILNGKLILVDNKDNLVMDTTSDVNGRFKFTDINVTDTPLMALQAKRKDKPDDIKIELKQPDTLLISGPKKDIAVSQDTIPKQTTALMRQDFNEMMKGGKKLGQVNIKGYKPRPKPDLRYSANLNGPGNANYVIMGDDLTGCMDLDCLYGKIPGVTSRNGKLYLSRNKTVNLRGVAPPAMALIIDGNLFLQGNHADMFERPKALEMLNIKDIYSIEVLESGAYLAMYGSNAFGGALVITTRRGGENSSKAIAATPGIIRFPYKGYYKARSFYSPKYEHPETAKQKDLRSAIYWQPELLTDKDGNASFEYYNADGHGTYRVTIEGMDSEGNIGRQVYHYKVE